MYGADVAQLRDTAAELRRSAERLTSSRTTLSATLAASPWSGPDSERFRGEWQGALSRILQDAGARLAAAADALERNAADQEATSAVGGGAAAGAGTASGPYGGSADHPPAGASAQDVTRWWDSLTPAQQRE
ncbi:MAG: WXG100 family type VII secretion target, partial [Microbacterium sp.]|nr:WXG100 family type VII secretion target [Microbacterium sp.]